MNPSFRSRPTGRNRVVRLELAPQEMIIPSPWTRLRRLIAVFVALTLMWGPLAVQSSAAMAMAPSSHHELMQKAGECHDEKSERKGHAGAKVCCAAMCSAIAVAPVASIVGNSVVSDVPHTVLSESGPSFANHLPTPPPRRA